MRRNALPKFIEYGDALLVLVRMCTNMGAGNQQKQSLSLEELRNIEIILF